MLRVIPNRLKAKAEELLVEQKAGFRPGRSTAEQTFYCRVIIEKHIQHQRDLFQNFIDFKMAFDRVWHAALWHVLRSFSIEEGLIQAIQALHKNSSSAVLLNTQLWEFFRTTVGVRQGCLLSPILFQEKITQEALHDQQASLSIGGSPYANYDSPTTSILCAEAMVNFQDLTNRLVDRATTYGIGVSKDNSKNNFDADIHMDGQKLFSAGGGVGS